MNATNPAVATLALVLLLGGCGDTANLSIAQGTGPAPQLPRPTRTLFPTVLIAEAVTARTTPAWHREPVPVA